MRMVWSYLHGRDRRPDCNSGPPGIRYRGAIRRFGATPHASCARVPAHALCPGLYTYVRTYVRVCTHAWVPFHGIFLQCRAAPTLPHTHTDTPVFIGVLRIYGRRSFVRSPLRTSAEEGGADRGFAVTWPECHGGPCNALTRTRHLLAQKFPSSWTGRMPVVGLHNLLWPVVRGDRTHAIAGNLPSLLPVRAPRSLSYPAVHSAGRWGCLCLLRSSLACRRFYGYGNGWSWTRAPLVSCRVVSRRARAHGFPFWARDFPVRVARARRTA